MATNKLAIDICNTIANVNLVLEDRLKLKIGDTYGGTNLNEKWFRENLWVFEAAQPYHNASFFLKWALKKTGLEPVYITARPETARQVTKEWLRRHQFPEGDVVFTRNKPEVAIQRNVLAALEDAPHEIEKYQRHRLPVFSKNQPYNRKLETFGFDWTLSDMKLLVQEIQKAPQIKKAL